MEFISERIINISELENKIKSARCNTNNVERFIKEKDYNRAEEVAKILVLQMNELDCFELQLEHRKIITNKIEEVVTMIKKCPRCSNENIKEDYKYCPICGFRLEEKALMNNKQAIEQLKEICKPIVEWLKENYVPYYTVVIKDEHIRLVRDEVGISIETAQEVPVQEQHKFVTCTSDGICTGGKCERDC